MIRLDTTAIDAAKAAGVRRIFHASHVGANPASSIPPMHAHAANEAALRGSGVAFTSLRDGFYAESARMLLCDALETSERLTAPDASMLLEALMHWPWFLNSSVHAFLRTASTTSRIEAITGRGRS